MVAATGWRHQRGRQPPYWRGLRVSPTGSGEDGWHGWKSTDAHSQRPAGGRVELLDSRQIALDWVHVPLGVPELNEPGRIPAHLEGRRVERVDLSRPNILSSGNARDEKDEAACAIWSEPVHVLSARLAAWRLGGHTAVWTVMRSRGRLPRGRRRWRITFAAGGPLPATGLPRRKSELVARTVAAFCECAELWRVSTSQRRRCSGGEASALRYRRGRDRLLRGRLLHAESRDGSDRQRPFAAAHKRAPGSRRLHRAIGCASETDRRRPRRTTPRVFRRGLRPRSHTSIRVRLEERGGTSG